MKFSITNTNITLIESEKLISNSIKLYSASFKFDKSWDGFECRAIFKNVDSDVEKSQPIEDGTCTVPWEVLQSRGYLTVGVIGFKDDGQTRPTTWSKQQLIYQGVNDADTGELAPTPTKFDILRQDVRKLEKDVEEIKENGSATITDEQVSVALEKYFEENPIDGAGADGVSPEITVTTITGGHRITIKDVDGTKSFTVMDGEDGADGINGKDGENGKDGADGEDGKDGEDGISPTVTIEEITGGHRVTITDINGPQSFDVMDGEDGKDGSGEGTSSGSDDEDGVSCYHEWNGTVLTITSASGTSSADLKGAKGDKGDKGDTGETGPEGPQGPQGPTGETGDAGQNGTDGKSAYAYAQEAGYSGTESDFAAKLAEDAYSKAQIDVMMGSYINDIDTLLGGDS